MVDNNDDENAEDKGDAGIGKAAEDMRPQKLRSVWLKTIQDGKDTSAPQHPENSITHVDHNIAMRNHVVGVNGGTYL